ncbi:hypothetical protein [Haloferax sp. DFSO60]|uniref:hypothetical protein n=1 Tax=Haloferax sp. DFSO60 TaxID=3388652 RepID=UPI00397D1DFB
MLRHLADRARANPTVAILSFEVVLAVLTLVGFALILASPVVSNRSLMDLGLPMAMLGICVLTVTSLLAAARRIVRLVTGRGGLAIESFWRMLEVMFALFVIGIVVAAIRLGQYAQSIPNPRGGGVMVGLFLLFVFAGIGLAVMVCLRAMWRVVSAEIQSALGAA